MGQVHFIFPLLIFQIFTMDLIGIMENSHTRRQFYEKRQPLIGFEPMTYALPWRYSTTELKGPFLLFLNESLCG